VAAPRYNIYLTAGSPLGYTHTDEALASGRLNELGFALLK